jgi:beta-galactosidase GanA
MREFWQNRYPRIWPPRERYFPVPVLNAWGEPVEDILEECAQRDIHGEPCRALWVECPDREHYNIMMDRNNPVWREYLKAVVRIQVDAGVAGVQFDETEVPITSLQYGGCFCRTCKEGFRDYLRALPPPQRPAELEGQDLAMFDYAQWLLARGYDFKTKREDTPLFWDYLAFQRRNIARYMRELADYTRSYARSQNREVLVSGNFFHLFDHYYAMEPSVDLIVTEMRNTTYRQPSWYRYAAGFAAGKPLIVVENPYGGVVPEMVRALKHGRGYDRFRQSVYEAAALGASMSLPYGSWMGSVIEDAFYAPPELCTEIGGFLSEHEDLYAARTWSETGVIYSVESNFRAMARRDLFQDNRTNLRRDVAVPFWEACDALSAAAQPYDVLFFPDGELRADALTAGDLSQYRVLVAPAVTWLTEAQACLLEAFADQGGRLVVLGAFGSNLDPRRRERLLGHSGTTLATGAFAAGQLPFGPQVRIPGGTRADLALTLQRVERGVALHVIRYDHDDEADHVPVLPEIRLDVRLPSAFGTAAAVGTSGQVGASVEAAADGWHRVRVVNMPLYTIVMLES